MKLTSLFVGKHMRTYALFFLTLLLGIASAPVRAQVGGAAVVFLMIEPDSRAAGMGNTGVAVADNASAVFWNPAGLAFQKGLSLSLTHANWLPEFKGAGLFYEHVNGRYSLPGLGTFGMHITYLNLGEHEGRDENNNPTGTFRSYDLAIGGSFARKINERFALGGGLRLIYSNLAPNQSVGGGEVQTQPGVSFGIDLAGLYRMPEMDLGGVNTQLSFGFNLANMGPTISYTKPTTGPNGEQIGGQEDPIPTNLRFGWSARFNLDQYNRLTLAMDFNKQLIDRDSTSVTPFYKAIFSSWKTIRVNTGTPEDPRYQELSPFEQLTIGVGSEYWYNDLFALRAGYFYENPYNGNRRFLTFGAGIRYNIIGVDFSYLYALEEKHPLSNTMRFSLLLDFSKR